jgi:hypothetical protein
VTRKHQPPANTESKGWRCLTATMIHLNWTKTQCRRSESADLINRVLERAFEWMDTQGSQLPCGLRSDCSA